jgi:hypothetical protein
MPSGKPTTFIPNPGTNAAVDQTTLYVAVGSSIGGAALYVLACLFIYRSKPLDGSSEVYKLFRQARIEKIHAEDFGTDEENYELEAEVDDLVYKFDAGEGGEEYKS